MKVAFIYLMEEGLMQEWTWKRQEYLVWNLSYENNPLVEIKQRIGKLVKSSSDFINIDSLEMLYFQWDRYITTLTFF